MRLGLTDPDAPGAASATAPVRVADLGGWTDTWFGAPGKVCNIAVGPGVTARATWVRRIIGAPPVRLRAPDVGADYGVGPDELDGWAAPAPGHHPLLEHAIAAVLGDGEALESDRAVEVRVGAAVPAGASLGTSASAVVAVLAALDRLVGGGRRGPAELARLAHQIETVRAGRESGVQDQWAAALGGASLLDVGPFQRGGASPTVGHAAIDLDPAVRTRMESCWTTVVFGSHDSGEVHNEVIRAALAPDGTGHRRTRAALRTMTDLAGEAAEALAAGDLALWGAILRAGTDAQERMHPALLGPAHRAAIDAARHLGATGWKVNGAGGNGGSLTVLFADPGDVGRYIARVAAIDDTWKVLDLRCSGGVVSVVEPG